MIHGACKYPQDQATLVPQVSLQSLHPTSLPLPGLDTRTPAFFQRPVVRKLRCNMPKNVVHRTSIFQYVSLDKWSYHISKRKRRYTCLSFQPSAYVLPKGKRSVASYLDPSYLMLHQTHQESLCHFSTPILHPFQNALLWRLQAR